MPFATKVAAKIGAQTYSWLAAGGETSFSGLDDASLTLRYNPATVKCYIDGHRLLPEDFVATTGTSITGVASMIAGQTFEVDGGGSGNPVASYNKTDSDARYALLGANNDITSLAGLTTPLSEAQGGTGATSAPTGNNPNLIINGGMTVSQRGTSFASPTSHDYLLDRWKVQWEATFSARVTVTQDTSGVFSAWGSKYAMKIDCTTADAAPGVYDGLFIAQKIEAQDLQHLEYAGASPNDITLSFLYQSPKSGTHSVALYNDDGAYGYAAEFTVASADTPELISVTIPGDSRGMNNDNGTGLMIMFPMAVGTSRDGTAGAWTSGQMWGSDNQPNLLDNTANNIYIGQVKLEVGSAATAFEHESYGDTLAKCQRYFWTSFQPGVAPVQNGGEVTGELSWYCMGTSPYRTGGTWNFPVTMRTAGTATGYNPAAANTFARNQVDNTDESMNVVAKAHSINIGAAASSDNAGDTMGIHVTVDAEL